MYMYQLRKHLFFDFHFPINAVFFYMYFIHLLFEMQHLVQMADQVKKIYLKVISEQWIRMNKHVGSGK